MTFIATMNKFPTYVVCELKLIHPIDELHLMEELDNVPSTNGAAVIVSIACCLDILLQNMCIIEAYLIGLVCVLLLGNVE